MHTVSPHLPGGRLPGGRLFAGVLGIVALALVAATLVTATPADAASRPGPVHGFKQAKETEHGFKLVWRRAARAGKYQVQVAANKKMRKARRTYTTKHRQKNFKHVAYGRDYYVRVRAVRGKARGPWTRVVHTGPYWVWNVRAKPVSTTRTKVSWARYDGANTYRLRIATDAHLKHVVKSVRTHKVHKTVRLSAATPGRTYFYRVYAYHGKHLRKRGALHKLQLKVARPGRLRIISPGGRGLTLQWGRSKNAQAYVIRRATNSAMTRGVKRYTSTTRTGRFAPPDLSAGTRYWFTVQAVNQSSRSTSNKVSGRMGSHLARVDVGSFNIHKHDPGNAKYPGMSWTSARANRVARLINTSHFDVLALQEAASSYSKVKVFDDLYPKIDGTYTTSGKPGYYKRGEDPRVRIVWRKGAINKVTGPQKIGLGNDEYAVAQKLRRGKAEFVFVSTHLASGKGRAKDDRRYAETKTLIARVRAFAGGLPVVYAGDYNSNGSHTRTYDAPALRFRAAGMPDANFVAARHRNARYNSANQLKAHPALRGGFHVDHFYVTPNVPVTFWEPVVRLRNASTYQKPFASDHNPIRATVQIPY